MSKVRKARSDNYSLDEVDPTSIDFDAKNPRGEKREAIEKNADFIELRKSVQHYGVLVPLIVKPSKKKGRDYKLIDGERRLLAALLERKAFVPVHIVDGIELNGRILAYNVHMLRKQWSKENEIASIKEIRTEVLKANPDMTEAELFKVLKDITNHKEHDLQSLLKMLKYDDSIIKKVQDGNLAMSYLVQIDSSFLVPFKREFPRLYNKYGDKNLRRILVEKAENGLLGNTRYLMENILALFRDDEQKNKLRAALKKFLDEKALKIEYVVNRLKAPAEKQTQAKTKKNKTVKAKKKTKKTSKAGQFQYQNLNISKQAETKIEDIRPKLEAISKTFSDEEREYIKEAIFCLENHCLKAAVLMLWASGVSRVIKYIEKNLMDFNQSSRAMADAPKSFYKYFAPKFMKNATSIDEIRENSNDRQLLCYLCFKKFITRPAFTKLKSNYDTRNECAHPTSIHLKPNELIAMFENVYELILNNKKIK